MNPRIRPIPLGFVFTSFITLITVFYIGSSVDFYEVQSYNLTNLTQLSPVRVFCLILTAPKNYLTRTKAVNETWAPRCDRYFFITEYLQDTMTPEQFNFTKKIPIAPLKNITPGYDHLTQKSTLAFLFAYENYLNDYDWFIKADDDTYLFVENLKTFLSEQNSSEPVTFGYNFKVNAVKGYHSGGASYVLSRESLRRFHDAHNDPKSKCSKDGGSEDVEIARCLRTKDVYPGKSLDQHNRERFHPLPFADHFLGSFPDWLHGHAENPPQLSYNCCSTQFISFHYVSPSEQYLMDFLLYTAQPSSRHGRRFIRQSNN